MVMISKGIHTILHNLFKEKERVNIITALLQDTLAISCLNNLPENHLEKLSSVDLWSPANIFLMGCKSERIREGLLKNKSLELLSNELWEKAKGSIGDFKQCHRPPVDLESCGYLALGIREEITRNESQHRNLDFLFLRENSTEDNFSRMRSVFTCLYGMVSDPLSQFDELIERYRSSDIGKCAIHALLSNPLQESKIVNGIVSILKHYSYAKQIELLRFIRLCGREQVVNIFAHKKLSSFQPKMKSISGIQPIVNYETLIQAIEEKRYIGMLHYYAGEFDLTRKIFEQIRDLLDLQRKGFNYESEFIDARLSSKSTVSDGLDLENNFINDKYTFFTINHILGKREINIGSDPEKQRGIAEDISDSFIDLWNNGNFPIIPWYLMDWNPTEIINSLVSLRLINRAFNLCEKLLGVQPNNVSLRKIIAEMLFDRGNSYKALEQILIALEFSPNDSEIIKLAVKINEDLCNWEDVLSFQERLLKINEDDKDVLEDYAFGLLHTKRIEEGIQILNRLVENKPDDWHLMNYLGYV
mgnify:CR=1 FL=1